MKFEQALAYAREGKNIRKASWSPDHYICKQHNMTIYDLIRVSELFEDDWKVRELSFKDIVNPLFSGKSVVCHIKDYNNPEKQICFRNNMLYKGWGTSKMHVYSFTQEDINANDWLIIKN